MRWHCLCILCTALGPADGSSEWDRQGLTLLCGKAEHEGADMGHCKSWSVQCREWNRILCQGVREKRGLPELGRQDRALHGDHTWPLRPERRESTQGVRANAEPTARPTVPRHVDPWRKVPGQREREGDEVGQVVRSDDAGVPSTPGRCLELIQSTAEQTESAEISTHLLGASWGWNEIDEYVIEFGGGVVWVG